MISESYTVEHRDISIFIREDAPATTPGSSPGVVNVVISNLATFAIKLKQLVAVSSSLNTCTSVDDTITLN